MRYANLLPAPVAVVPKATTKPSRTMRFILRLVRYPFAIALIATHALLARLWSKA